MPLGFPLKQNIKISSEGFLNEIANYNTKLKEFNNDQTGFIVQNKRSVFGKII